MEKYLLKKQVLILLFLLITNNLFSQQFIEQTGIILPGVSHGTTTWGDYNNDGKLDILVSGALNDYSAILKVFRNNGNNTFTDLGNVFTPALPPAFVSFGDNYMSAWIDFDNDTYLDIVFNGKNSDGGYELNIYRNEGPDQFNRTFTRKYRIVYITLQGGSSFDFGDYDNDGDADILVANSIASKVLKNQGNFVFDEQFSIALSGQIYSSSKWIDYDLDSDLDILLTGYSTSLYQNQGNNTFILQSGISLYGGAGGTNDWGDYNNDGFPDLLLTGGNSAVYKNNGNNTFSLLTGTTIKSISKATGDWGDIDNDGDLDIVQTGNFNYTTDISEVYINNGNNTFTLATGITLDGVSEGSLDLGDYDNDGDLDIILSGKKGPENICKVYKNTPSLVNPVPAPPAGLTTSSAGNDIILKWNRVTTDNTAPKALSYNIMAGIATNTIDLVNPMATVATGFRKIAAVGNSQFDTAFILRNIKKGTYKWKVQAIDNSFKGSAFSSEGTFTYSVSFQSYALGVKNAGGKEATLSWARGNGDNCIVFAKAGTSGSASPVNNTTYNASSAFGSGTQIGSTGWFCIYKGSLNFVKINQLNPLTDYIIQVLEFTGNSGSELYNNSVTPENSKTFKTGIFTELTNTPLASVISPSLNIDQWCDIFWFDFDNNNSLDFFITGLMGKYLYKYNGSDSFVEVPTTLGYSQYADCGDINNDGNIDITLLNNSEGSIYLNNGNSTFTKLGGTSITGTSYGSVDWADYDIDGDLDLLLTGEAGSFACVAKIYRNNGDSTLTEVTNHNITGVRYGSTAWGDFDNDGYPDLALSGITLDLSSITSIYRNDRKGAFIKIADISNEMSKVKWGDYDNDGDLDLLVISQLKNMIFRNNGNSTFTNQVQINIDKSSRGDGSWGDYNNDGYLDILITGFIDNYIPSTKVYKNNKDNTFEEDLNCNLTPAGHCEAAWGDYDDDGDLDILIIGLNADGGFTKIFRNDINTTNQIPPAPLNPTSTITKSEAALKWESVRTDNTPYQGMSYNIKVGKKSGAIDIVSPHSFANGERIIAEMGNANLDTTLILKNLPLGNYSWSVQAVDNSFKGGAFSAENSFSIVPVQATNLTAEIMDNSSLLIKWERGNGYRCIVFCKEGTTGNALPVNKKSYLQDSEFGYGEQIETTGWYCVFNGRNDSIVVTGLKYKTDYSFHVIEYLGNPGTEQYFTQLVSGNPGVFSTGLFSEQTGIILSSSDFGIYAWGDYDNDGFSDLIIPGSSAKLYENNGDNSFSTVTQAVFANGRYGSSNWGDYDNDGDLDLLITGATGNSPNYLPAFSKIYRNNGSGLFSEQTLISLQAVFYSSADWGDYDNDGDLDIILTGATGNDPYYNPISMIYRNNGNGTFTEQSQINLPGVFRGEVKWVDYDNDGDLDIHLSGGLDYQYYSNCFSRIYRNNGNNTFSWQSDIHFPNLWEASVDWADYDNDGNIDVVMSTPGMLYAYRNTGGSFTQILSKGYGYSSYGSVCWGDYNNDGFPDILFSNFAGSAIIFRNNNGHGFTESGDASFNFTQVDGLDWCDYDNDGDIDIIVNRWGEACKLYKNNLFMKSGLYKPNNPPIAPTGLKNSRSPSGITLSWNPVKTDETPFLTLSYNIKIGNSLSSEDVCPSHSLTSGFREKPVLGNAQLDTTYLSKNLASGKYYWRVQGVDQGFKGGNWSAIDSFEVKNVQTFFSSDEVCYGLPTHFTDQSVATDGIASWKWDFNDGTTSSLQNPVHTFTSWSSNYVKLVITSTTGTKDSLEQNISVKPKPLTDFSATTACQGAETSLINLTDASGLNITSWSWDYGDGKGSTEMNPGNHGYLTANDYQVKLTAVADNSCSSSIKKTVSVGAYPVASISATGKLNFCEGDSIILNVPYNSTYTYKWILDNLEQPNSDSSKFAAKISGEYTSTVINPLGNCESVSLPVNVNAKPVPFKPAISSLNYQAGQCPPISNKIKLTLSPEISGYSYQWYRNGAPYSNGTLPNLEDYLPQGNYSVESILDGCKAVSDNFILSYAVAPEKPTILVKGPVVWYMATNKNSYKHYKWYLNDQLIAGATKYIYVANKRLGTYRVEVADDICYTSSDKITIPIGKSSMSNFNIPTEYMVGDEIDAFGYLKIYPNPTPGLFTIEMDNDVYGELNISILTQSGKEILNIKFEKTTEHFSAQVDLTGQLKGIYIINLEIEKYTATKKLIID